MGLVDEQQRRLEAVEALVLRERRRIVQDVFRVG
jgi:hypothetical protein